MLSHRNILFQLEYADFITPLREGDQQLSFLPLCHVAERTFSVFNPLYTGATVNFAESIDTVPDNIREVAPALFFAVPRIWEKFYSGVALRMRDATWLGRFAYDRAIRIGLRLAACRIEGRRPSPRPAGRIPGGRLPRARQRQALDRPAPGPRRRHRRGPDRPGPDPLVPGARARHVRGLRSDREHRPRHRDAARPHQARDGGRRASGNGSPPVPRGRDSVEGPARVPGLLRQAGQDRGDRRGRLAAHRRRRAPSTPTASFASPTA